MILKWQPWKRLFQMPINMATRFYAKILNGKITKLRLKSTSKSIGPNMIKNCKSNSDDKFADAI